MYAALTQFWDDLRDDRSYDRLRHLLIDGHTGLVLLLLFIAVGFVWVRTTYIPLHVTSDTAEYVETAELMDGVTNVPVHGNRLLKPLAPYAMTMLAPIMHGNYPYHEALEILSVAFYYALAVLIYAFAFLLLKRRQEAFIAALLYLSSYPILLYGLDLYTETGAWFFHLLGLYYAARYYLERPTLRYVALSAAASTLGLLWKEYAVLSGLALIVLIAITDLPWRTKLAHLATAAAIALPVLIGIQMVVYAAYHYTYLDWFILGGPSAANGSSQYTPFYIAKSLFALLLLGWMFVAAGVRAWRTFDRAEIMVLSIAGVSALLFLAWGFVSSRLYFVLMPVLVVIAARGISRIERPRLRAGAVLATVSVAVLWVAVRALPSIHTWLPGNLL